MRFNFEHLSNFVGELAPSTQELLARLTLAALLVGGVASMALSTYDIVQVLPALRKAQQMPVPSPRLGASTGSEPAIAVAPPSNAASDFVAELPAVAPSDAQIRFAAKIAREARVIVVQMQTEPLKADPKTLGQSRLTLQLRGDYRDIKTVWIALIEKYPGLVLERMTIRHHADVSAPPGATTSATALPPADRADDEATLEMIQYTRPSELPR